ncbi:Ig-like domain-containing protein [bacterium]|nr:Ig-like domain-containing protein [bacterium]
MRRILFAAILCLLALPVQVFSVGLPPGTTIELQATGQYTDAYDEDQIATPATLTLTVVQVAGASIEWSPSPDTSTPGEYMYFPMRIINTGNYSDSFALTSVSENGWSTAIIYDDDNDGVHDSDEDWEITNTSSVSSLVADAYCPCFLRVSIPEDATQSDKVTVTAISDYNAAQGTASAEINIPEPNMRSTRITASASPDSPYVGQDVTISGALQPAMSRELTVYIDSPDDTSATSTVTTGDDGSFTSTFNAAKVGTYQVLISFDGDESYIASDYSMSVVAQDKVTSSIELTCDPSAPTLGESVTITGMLSPVVEGAAIVLTCTVPNGSSTQHNLATSANGTFTWNTTIDEVGTWYFRAAFAGDETCTSTTKQLAVVATDAASEHTITIDSGPSLDQSEVVPGSSVQCSVSATDSLDSAITYHWSDGDAGGTFMSSADDQNPIYTAPTNDSGEDVAVTLTCTATSTSDDQISASKSTQLTVSSTDSTPPEVASVTPASGAEAVSAGTNIVITFSEAMEPESTEAAFSIAPAVGSIGYTWSADAKTLTITHADFSLDSDYTCSIASSALDANGNAMAEQYTWAFSTVTAASFDPAQMTVEVYREFTTPHIVLNDAQATTYTALIHVPENIEVSDSMSGGSLACVEAGDDVSSLTSSWDTTSRIITINVEVSNPSTPAEIVKSISLTAPSESGSAQISINGCSALDITIEPPLPGDFNSDHVVNITDAADFVQEWVRWHSTTSPVWDDSTDGPFDLAPCTDGTWPNWTAEGDGCIDIQDAAAFIDCWVGSHTSSEVSSANYVPAHSCRYSALSSDSSDEIYVVVDSATGGMFETSVGIPDGRGFSPVMDGSGNLKNVVRGAGSGAVFFSEYDKSTRTVHITGSVTGAFPYLVAIIKIK